MKSTPLKKCTLVVTRPTGQAEQLVDRLQQAGATTLHFPVIDISPAIDQAHLLAQAKSLKNYDIAIFISRNAANYGSAFLPVKNWPENTAIAAIGRGTARQLEDMGYCINIVSSSTENTEGLLAEPAMNEVRNKRILIIRGNGGREKLAEMLRTRGATVDYFECYRRSRPQINTGELYSLWDNGNIDGIIVTSAEGLKNLYQMVDHPYLERLNSTPLFVISTTMVELCGKLGYKLNPVLMPAAHDDDVKKAVIAHCEKQ